MVKEIYEKLGVRRATYKDHEYKSYFLALPRIFVKDSTFPFTEKDELVLRIEDDRIIIEKAR